MKGLTSQKVSWLLKKHGYNEISSSRRSSAASLLLAQFGSPLIYVLVAAGIITLWLGDYTDTLVIMLAVIVNAALGFYQEYKAQRTLDHLRSLVQPRAMVIRNGSQQVISAKEVVPGDIAILSMDYQIPADGKLLEAQQLSVNEAMLTGESVPISKSVGDKVFMGTKIVHGYGKMKVKKTGAKTEIGKIGYHLDSIHDERTPLQEQIAGLARYLTIALLLVLVVVFLVGWLTGYDFTELFATSVAVAVAAIPEGLVIAVTVILAVGMQQILKRQAIVRKLVAAETLGAVTVICADKTGTLTEGMLKVSAVDAANAQQAVAGAILVNSEIDPLEIALSKWTNKQAKKLGWRKDQLQKTFPLAARLPFDPENKLAATLHQINNEHHLAGIFPTGSQLLVAFGAPDELLKRSRLSAAEKQIWEEKLNQAGQKGYRLTALGFRIFTSHSTSLAIDDVQELQWLALVKYEDPIRQDVKSTFKLCQQAGIKIKVITGDYAATAIAVMARLHLLKPGDITDKVVTGAEWKELTVDQKKNRINSAILFARTTPTQKLEIVKLLKEQDEVVAMMGDGVNDAPALKQADIGIVVNEASDVSKETADLILLDSSLRTIVKAVEQGRLIFANIQRVIVFLLSDAFTEVILLAGALALGLPLPVTAAQILWVNLIEDSLPSLALAFEQGAKGVMKKPPRPRRAPLLNSEMKAIIFAVGISSDIILLSLSYYLFNYTGFAIDHIRTLVFAGLAIDSLLFILACRSLTQPFWRISWKQNWMLLPSLLFGVVTLIIAIYTPGIRDLLQVTTLSLSEWGLLLLLGAVDLVLIEFVKWLWRLKS